MKQRSQPWVVVLVTAVLGMGLALPADAADRDYEVISVDVDGRPASNNAYGPAWGNMQPLAPYSVSADGSKVVFAKRQGPYPNEPGNTPLAPDEWCGQNGGCRDLFVRNLTTQSTESVLSHLEVQGLHPLSFPTVGSAGGSWAVSADATTFVFGWYCYREFDDHPEVIGGTPICESSSPVAPDRWALILLDIDTGYTEVLGTGAAQPGYDVLDLSANGNLAVFDGLSTGPPESCFRPDWVCDEPLLLWERGESDLRLIGDTFGTITGASGDMGDFRVEEASISGDGSEVFFLVRARDWNDIFAPDSWRLFAYNVSGGTYKEIALPWQTYPGGNWGMAGSSHDGSVLIVTTDTADGLPVRVDVSNSSVRVLDTPCDAGVSLSNDARYIGCWRGNSGQLPPAIIDTVTGKVTDLATPGERFPKTNAYQGPYISGDGQYFAVLHHRSPEDDNGQSAGQWPMQVYGASVALTSGAPGSPFVDDDGHIFENAITWLASRGITRGCNPPVNDRFCPNDQVTRGQMAAFLVRAFGLPAYNGPDRFVDDDGHVFEGAIERLAQAGITRGCNPPVNDRFCPNDQVTRGQMAAFLVRAFGLPAYNGPDRFVDDDGHVFEGAIERLAQAGITRGCNPPVNDRFCPNDQVTRGQMAAFLKRAFGA